MNTSAAVAQAINSSSLVNDKPLLKFTPCIMTSTSLLVKLHSEMRHVGGNASSACGNSKSPNPMQSPSTSSSLLPTTTPLLSSAPSSQLTVKPGAGSPSIYASSTFGALISTKPPPINGSWADIMLSVGEKEERERAQREGEERERKAKEESEKEAKKAAVPRQNPNDTHKQRLDILEEELKRVKEKTKQLMETRKKGAMDTWEKLKLKSFLGGSTSTEKVKVNQTASEQRSVSPPAALRPLVNSTINTPGVMVPRVRPLRCRDNNELTQKQPSMTPNSPTIPSPSPSSSTSTTVPPPLSSAAPPPPSDTPSTTSRSHSPTNPMTRRPVPKSAAPLAPRAPRAMTNFSFTGGAPPVPYRPKVGLTGVAPPTGPRAGS